MTTTSTELHSSLSQEEKRREMDNDRKAREQGKITFKDFASAFASEGRESGRFAKINPPTVQPLPPNSPWSSAQPTPGEEPALGVNIDQVGKV
jgi:hypothetical protein